MNTSVSALILLALLMSASSLTAVESAEGSSREKDAKLNTGATSSDTESTQQAPGELIDVGGFRLHLQCTGPDGAAVTVFFEAGLGGSSLEWRPVIDALGSDIRSCRYDRAGYAWSELSPYPRHLMQLLNELELLLDHSDNTEGPLILVGHSMGGLIMRLLAQRQPERVVGLVLVDSSHESQLKRMETEGALRLLPSSDNFRLSPLPVPDALPIPERRLVALFSRSRRTRMAIYGELKHFRQSLKQVERFAMPLGDLPLVVVHRGKTESGATQQQLDRELIWEGLQHDLAALSNRSERIRAIGNNHHIHITEPQLIADAVRAIMDRRRHGVAHIVTEPDSE